MNHQETQDADILIPISDFCRRTKISRTALHYLEKDNLAPPSIKVGRRRYYVARGVEEWIKRKLKETI